MLTDNNEKWNFRTLLSQGTFVDISYQLTSPNLVLPFLYMAVGAPVLFAGLILPIVQASNLVSQIVSAPILSGRSLRKWYIALSLITMAAALSIVGIASGDTKAEWLAVIFLLVAAAIGISQGVAGLAHQDMLGRVLPPDHRTTLLFVQTGLAGLFTIVIAFGSQHYITESSSLNEHLELLWAGIAVAVFAGIAATFIRETPPASSANGRQGPKIPNAGKSLFKDIYVQFTSAAKIPWFRRFLIARMLFLSIELAMPFYAIHAATYHARDHRSLSMFVIASSVGLVIGGVLWQRISQISIPAVMGLASIFACAAGGLAVIVELVPEMRSPWLHGGTFFLIAMAAQGTQNSRKLYLVSLTSDEERPRYIAASNAVIGAIAVVVAFAFGALAHLQAAIWPVWCIIALNVMAALYATQIRGSVRPNRVEPGSGVP